MLQMSETTKPPEWFDRPRMLEAWETVHRLERGAVDAEHRAVELEARVKSTAIDARHARIRADRAWGALGVVLRCWATNTPPPAEALAVLTAIDRGATVPVAFVWGPVVPGKEPSE